MRIPRGDLCILNAGNARNYEFFVQTDEYQLIRIKSKV